MRLNAGTAAQLASCVERPVYPWDQQRIGIVHLGIGAFHRAHQAWYTDLAMDAGDRNWAIAGVSMRSGDVAAQLAPQDGLYTVSERRAEGRHVRLVASVRELLVASSDAGAVIARMEAPDTSIISLTITEKGYCRAADGALDAALAARSPVYQLLAAGLRRRCNAGLPGLSLLSCDNLADNGKQLSRLVSDYLRLHDPELEPWFRHECSCPSTMVDRVVPAPTDEGRLELAAAIGMRDEGAVITEPFSQWVIEDKFAGRRPAWEKVGVTLVDWEKVGVTLVDDVRPYEAAKLRMLNAAHSALAYIGLLRGHQFVHEAVTDPFIRPLAQRLMREEAAPTLIAEGAQGLEAYADTLTARFENPALRHRLSQIAIDGSQKIPQRWLATLAANQKAGRPSPAILQAIAAWLLHVRGANGPVDDPFASRLLSGLLSAWESAGESEVTGAVFGPRGPMASAWSPSIADREEVLASLVRFSAQVPKS